jgi:NNP family nitrate/nitrite transporter-like MFS transporter
VLYINFVDNGQTAAQASLHVAQIAFLGPLLGSLSRIYGGRLADRIGGSRVTLAVFAGMIAAAGLLVAISTYDENTGPATSSAAMVGYIVGFIALFILSGIGNASVFKMIPSIFEARSRELNVSEAERRRWSRAMSGALIGFAGAVGALGGVAINLTLRESYVSTGEETSAFWMFLAFYVVASFLTWTMYVRLPVSAPRSAGSVSEPTPARL